MFIDLLSLFQLLFTSNIYCHFVYLQFYMYVKTQIKRLFYVQLGCRRNHAPMI